MTLILGKFVKFKINYHQIFYTILHPVNEDFLSKLEETEDTRLLIRWSKHPLEAIKFASEEEAINKAHELLKEKEKGYELIICQVNKIGEQLKVKESGRIREGNLLM